MPGEEDVRKVSREDIQLVSAPVIPPSSFLFFYLLSDNLNT